MNGFIYKITNKVNGKSYIGQTRHTVEFRWRQHKASKDCYEIHKAIQKYGCENFSIETLEECNVNDLNSREIFYISKYDTFRNGYNMTKGGSSYNPNRRYRNGYIVVDDKYDEITSMYLSGFSATKIANIYQVDKHVIYNILDSLGIRIKKNVLNINSVETEEIKKKYNSGYSLRQLAKEYGCSGPAMSDFLKRKGVDLRQKYDLLKEEDKQKEMIQEYLKGDLKVSELQSKYHCSYSVFKKVLSLHNINLKGLKGNNTKLNDKQCLIIIGLFNEGKKAPELAKLFGVDKDTIYSMFKKYNVNYKKI